MGERLCAQLAFRMPNSACALLDGNQHDIRYTYNTAQQRKDTYHPNGRTKQTGNVLRLYVLCEAVPYPDCAFIFRVETMIGGNDFPVFFFKGFIGFLTREVFGGEDDVVKLVALVINGLQGREGDKGHAALVALGLRTVQGYLIGYATALTNRPTGSVCDFPKRISADFYEE